MRQFSIFDLLWFTAAAGMAIAVNFRARSYDVFVFQPVDSPVMIHERGFPLSYTIHGTQWYWQLSWIACNTAIVFVVAYLALRLVGYVQVVGYVQEFRKLQSTEQ